MELAKSCCRPKQPPLLRSIFLSFIGLWVKIWHRNKTACSKLNPVQSSRSKSTTYPRKGHLLRYELNSTATSDSRTQKLGNYVCHCLAWFWIDCNQSLQPNAIVWHDSELIATKVCSQIGDKWNAMFESSIVATDQHWMDFWFEDFVSTTVLLTNHP